jgi:hypothetical protein
MLLMAATSFLTAGCVLDPIYLAQSAYVAAAYPEYSEANMYAPGGALADKHVGTMSLDGATEVSITSLVPVGTTKSQVRQTLGSPASTAMNTDGTSSEVFTHTFTSYQNKLIRMETLAIEYDASANVSKTTLTHTNSTW